MALPATDSFTNSNGTQLNSHNANWDEYNAMDIQSNAAAPDTVTDECSAVWTGDTFNDDQYSQGVLAAVGAAVYIGVSARGDGADTYYGYYTDSVDGAYLYVMDGGAWTELGSGGVLAATNTMRIEASGTTITPKVNGALDVDVGAQTDATIGSGDAGVCGYDDGAISRIDDWEGGNLAGAGVIGQVAGVAWASVGQLATVAEASIAQVAGVVAN